MIQQPALDCEIMSMASEDMYGLHEIVWTLNVSHPNVAKEDKVAAAQSAVRSLLSRKYIVLHRLQWHPTLDLGAIPPDQADAVITDPASWEASQEYIGFVATAAGRREYQEGKFFDRGLTDG